MRIRIRYIFTMLCCLAAVSPAFAQEAADTVYNIVDQLNSSGIITITEPESLDSRMRSDSDMQYIDNSGKSKGKDRGDERTRYSIQIFSENKGQASKKNAEYRKRIVEQRMPGVHARVDYNSPYWRVRVGSYRTEAEARAAERDLKSKFPSFAGEIRIVRMRIK